MCKRRGMEDGRKLRINKSKTRGMEVGRKLKRLLIIKRWADKQYKKSLLGNEWRRSLIVVLLTLKKLSLRKCELGIEAKQPNSAIRKCARVQLIQNGKKITAYDGCLNYIEENDEVLIAGFGRKGHAVGDIPFKVVFFKEKK